MWPKKKKNNNKNRKRTNLSLDIESFVSGLECHILEVAEGDCSGVQLASFLVLAVAQLHLEFTALVDVAVFTV